MSRSRKSFVRSGARGRDRARGPYAVIHAAPMFRYKRWHAEGWRALAARLAEHGLAIVATGGPGEAERRYLDDIWDGDDVRRLDGQLSWPELAALLAGARVFVGPDTSVTHLAAAAGCPTVALYGPTDPRLWGPWPVGGLDAALGRRRDDPAARQCLAGAESAAVQPCQHEGLPAPSAKPQPLPGRTAGGAGDRGGRPGAGSASDAGARRMAQPRKHRLLVPCSCRMKCPGR